MTETVADWNIKDCILSFIKMHPDAHEMVLYKNFIFKIYLNLKFFNYRVKSYAVF